MKYCKELTDRICQDIRDGYTQKKACEKEGVSSTQFHVWMNKYTAFAEAIEKAHSDFDANIVRVATKGLMELVTGFEYDEKKTEYEKDPLNQEKPRIVKQTITHKKVAPNITAIIFALTNKDPEQWKNRQYQQIDGKVKTEGDTQVSLANVPDELLAEVISKINGK